MCREHALHTNVFVYSRKVRLRAQAPKYRTWETLYVNHTVGESFRWDVYLL